MNREYKARINKARKQLRHHKLQSLLITNSENITYLTGINNLSEDEREAMGLLSLQDFILFISPLRSFRQNMENDKILKVIPSSNFLEKVKSIAKKKKIGSIGFEPENLRVAELRKIKKILKSVKLKPTSNFIEIMRMIKEQNEIEKIRKACRITVRAYKKTHELIEPGITEKDLAWQIEKLIHEEGKAGIPQGFSPIVAFGENTSIPHHKPGTKKLQSRDIILMDFGCTYRGYISDFTRVKFIGKPSKLEKKVMNIVRSAQKLALEKITNTDNLREVDREARNFIARSGFKKFFIHNTGHGVGLSIHEAPSVSLKEKTRLQQNMVLTIEPGVYLPGKFGIRLEDTVLVKENSVEILTI